MIRIAALLPRSLKPWLWKKLSGLMHLHYRLPSGIEVRITSFSDWCIYNDIFVAGEYDDAIDAAMDRAKGGASFRVVDLGANVGFFTLRVLDRMIRRKISFPVVDCLLVEASPRLQEPIYWHLDSVGMAGLRIKIVNGLVGKKTGSATLEIRASECMNQVTTVAGRRSREVAYYDLDGELSAVPSIELLKCDIEGSERDFLEHYAHLLRKTAVAIFEFHEPQCPAKSGIAEVMKAGFSGNRILLDQGHAQTVVFER
jgi:FkbM family methyltransferase